MLVLKGRKSELIHSIRSSPEETEAFLKAKASIPLLAELVGSTKIKTLFISQKMLETLPKRALEPLRKVGVAIQVMQAKRGRPFTHPLSLQRQILCLSGKGADAKEIAGELKLPLRTVYYYLGKSKAA